MQIYRVNDADAGSKLLSKKIIEAIKLNPKLVLGLITGSTPIKTYELLAKDHQKNQTDWSGITTFNLDEYFGLEPTNENSYHYFMHKNLFNNLNIKQENIHIPQAVGNINENIENYEYLLKSNIVDIQLLGIGENGHIGFNEPFSSPHDRTRVVSLNSGTINANQKFFNSIDEVPQQALTMGIENILEAKCIILIAFGIKKSEAIKALMSGKVDEKWPCTHLNSHQNVIVIADKEACALLDQQ